MAALRGYVEWIVDHAGGVIAATLLVTALALVATTRLQGQFDIETSLPADHPYVRVDHEIRSRFGGRNYVVIAVIPRRGDVWRAAVLRKVKEITFEALRLPNVIPQNVVSLAAPSVRYFEESGGAISSRYLMREVPETPEEIAALRARVEADPLYRGTLVSDDQRAALVFVDFWEGIDRIEIYHALERLAAAHRDRDTDIVFMGQPVISYTLRSQTAALGRGFLPAVTAIALLLLVSFRSLQGMLIPMLTAFFSATWAMAFLALAGMPLDGWNASVPILIVAVAAGHSAQMLKRYQEELERHGDNREAVVTSTERIGPVMIAAGSTAALGFASLVVFRVQSIRNFGLSAAAGIASAVILEMTFIPALRSRLRPRGGKLPHRPRGDAVLAWLARLGRAHHGAAVFVPAALAIALALYGMSIVETGTSVRSYLPRGSVALRYRDAIDAHYPGTVTFGILLSGKPGTMNTARAVRLMHDLQEVLADDPDVLRTASFTDLLAAVYRAFEPGARGIPEDPRLVAQLAFLGSSPAFERFTDRSYSRSVVWAYLRDDNSAAVRRIIARVRSFLATHPPGDGIRVALAGGVGPTVLALNEHTTRGKVVNILAVLGVIFVVASIVLRAPLGGLYVTVPIAVSVLMDFGILGLTGTHLEMGTASTIAIGTGIGADYAIYIIYRLREELAERGDLGEAMRVTLLTSGRAVLLVASSIAAGFATLAPSAFPGLRTFGLIMPLTMLASALAAVFLLPALLAQARPRFIVAGRRAARGGA